MSAVSNGMQERNPQDSQGQCGKDDMSANTGAKKKRSRTKKIRNVVLKNSETCVISSGSSLEVHCLEVESCTTGQDTSDTPNNVSSVTETDNGSSPIKSPKKNARKRGKKQAAKLDVGMSKQDKSLNPCERKNESRCSQPGVDNVRNVLQRERKRITSNGPDFNSPLHRKNEREMKMGTPRNRNQSFVDEDSFEDYLPINVVEGLLQLPNYLQGEIRINQKAYTEAYISDPSGGRDILIDGVRNRNRALEGDEVVVAILPESQWRNISATEKQRTAKVIHIVNAVHPRQAIGVLKPMPIKNSPQAQFSPRDSRVPRMRVPIQECPPGFENMPDALYFACITKWDNVRFARGSLLGSPIGLQGDIDAETMAILLENEIRSIPYPPDLVPKFPENLREEDFKNREDLRKECIFSIDPITARDLDDAVSCEVLENGNYLIGVHISDVSHYLEENTPLDHLVATTATTTYLVQSVYHMLPREMTMKCSLLPGEDKLAYSVFWELQETDTEVKVISHRFTRSVVNSCAQLAYEHAQIMLDNPDKVWLEGELPPIYNGFTPAKLSWVVRNLNRLAIKLRNRRFESGCLRIDQTKLNFNLDDDGIPSDYSVYINKESHRLIEEFMLLANITVATALHDAFPQIAFLRQHSPPLKNMMDKLREQLELFGVVINTESAGALQESLAVYRDATSIEGIGRSIALNSLFAKPMARAKYFCLSKASTEMPIGHYALNVPIYTHFTSPIRRYADVMVHRLLSAYLNYTSVPNWSEEVIARVASNCNKRKYNAKKAGEQSCELYLALYLKERGPITGYAVVVDVKDRSFDAIFADTGTTVRIYSDKVGAEAETVENGEVFNIVLTWFPSEGSKPIRQVISLFSIVNVQLKCSSANALKIEPALLPPWKESKPSNSDAPDNSLETPKVNGMSSTNSSSIDLSNFKLPDILDDVQECSNTSDEDLSSPESVCESPPPLDDKELKNITFVPGCRRM